MTRTVQGEVASVRGRDVGFLLFLTFLNVINYIDRQLLADSPTGLSLSWN